MSHGEFSVWVFTPDDYHFPVVRFIDAETAVRMAHRITTGIEQGLHEIAEVRAAERVIITDGGDDCVFEWKRGEGVTWPKR